MVISRSAKHSLYFMGKHLWGKRVVIWSNLCKPPGKPLIFFSRRFLIHGIFLSGLSIYLELLILKLAICESMGHINMSWRLHKYWNIK